MTENKIISGFSKLTREEKIRWLIQDLNLDESTASFLNSFELTNSEKQSVIADLSENQLSNYHLPFSVAPNFLVDGKILTFPLVTEESSVVAALAKAAGYWAKRGGFHTQIIGTKKKGQVHFQWNGNPEKLKKIFPEIKSQLLKETAPITENMEKRGGGIREIKLIYLPEIKPDYYQIDVSFETRDAMGANFINSCLEQIGKSLTKFIENSNQFSANKKEVEIVMAILSNYVPDSRVKVWVKCPVEELIENSQQAHSYAEKFALAVHIARNDVSRAVTHNKGIFNGMDALAVATGNDYRAIEAGAHAYASKDGQYHGLSNATVNNGIFRFELEIPLAVGVVGGVTALHPLAKLAMKILKNPSASELMGYIATAGLASNWAAVNALITSGIQKGHMKMQLPNILSQFNLSEEQKAAAKAWFSDKDVSYSQVQKYLENHD
ncbi:3-hydroxy-3-methylglutaryl-coenzyme A reductase [Tangfeifania diversioriginum]|uniref:3-hydroxy-3-methylglutaryl coenzyme A reductase n=1 Tax=Tangfeifania diversioriginum TaxID=1168035 RepID=A0A1M6J5V5_9BACT|nr:hydroxymethylglutaryl-CoA reductase, degradative [Tangfeifania diversioriginum]SHJ42085.1 3-hydroxy-3-methylglutaryl-coenzyme A reductase [Tangfeifania diversioriginum]